MQKFLFVLILPITLYVFLFLFSQTQSSPCEVVVMLFLFRLSVFPVDWPFLFFLLISCFCSWLMWLPSCFVGFPHRFYLSILCLLRMLQILLSQTISVFQVCSQYQTLLRAHVVHFWFLCSQHMSGFLVLML